MAEPIRVGLVAGVTGIAGLNLAKKMLTTDKYGQWTVYGLSRRVSKYLLAEVNHVTSLTPPRAKSVLPPTMWRHAVFYTAWINKGGEDAMGQTATILPTPYKESMGRLPNPNFYYTLEDILFERAKQDGFTGECRQAECHYWMCTVQPIKLGNHHCHLRGHMQAF